MLVISYTNSYRALDHFVERHNDQHEELTEKIKASVLFTAKEIIRIYGAFLVKASSFMELSSNKLPALKTNNSQLAKLVKVSSRTIQRHIIKLQEAGIITNKKFCGSNSGYELLINSDILLATCRKDLEDAKRELEKAKQKSVENQDVKKEGTTKCPHTYTSNNSYNKSNLLIGVDNSEHTTPDLAETGNKLERSSLSLTQLINKTGYTTGNILTGNTREKGAENFVPEAIQVEEAREKVHKRAGDNNWKQYIAPARCASLRFYAERLWHLAKMLLYKDVFLTDFQEKQAKEMLVGWYEPVADSALSRVHQNYCERIGLARDFVAKDPERRFVQLPYKYFDTNNPSGFTGTKIWYKKHLERKEEVRKKLILYAQIRKFQNNEKKDVDKRRSPLEVYRECETRVGKLKEVDLLQLFYASVLKPEIIQQIK
ncbi:MAG: hypothetical protein HOG05_17480 [Bacteroidetes bacterium]|nr:hypothetical protein [Bacteroidota bacterium]MBT3802942.1 hypothetical protein [Bacteroidota bacterium]MBT3934747.1 hypothetical protein [Bacteroidota bacterium]MBT5991870.1 hypothetical protein [Bacteroidota bacterium]MBT6837456.1 hypothetical protein [Bacteroidota bacterium]